MAKKFSEKQGQYPAFIESYTVMYGRPPAEADLQRFFRVAAPTVHQMVLPLEKKGFIARAPGTARSIELLIDPDPLPWLKRPT